MKCCSCPHGLYAILPIVVLLGAFSTSFIAVNSCRFVRMDLTDYKESLELGLFGYMETSTSHVCTLYSTEDTQRFDTSFHIARMAAALATGVGGAAMVVSWLLSCVAFHTIVVRLVSLSLLFSAACQCLPFLVLHSNICQGIQGGYFQGSKDYTCTLTQGAIVSVVAAVAWFVSAVIVFKTPPYSDFTVKEVMGARQVLAAKTMESEGQETMSAAAAARIQRGGVGEGVVDGPAPSQFPDLLHGGNRPGGGGRNPAHDEDAGESVVSYEPSEISYGPSCISYGVSVITDADYGVDDHDVGKLEDVSISMHEEEEDGRRVVRLDELDDLERRGRKSGGHLSPML